MIETLIDKATIDLLGVLVTGVGIYAVLTKASVPGLISPQIAKAFWDHNPYVHKRDTIESKMTFFYTWVALAGFGLQGLSVILGGVLPERLYSWPTYTVLFSVGAALCWPLTKFVAQLALKKARSAWLPEVIKSQHQLFSRTCEIFGNDDLATDEANALPADKSHYTQRKKANAQSVEQNLSQFEDLLELEPLLNSGPSDRLARLKPYFEMYTDPEAKKRR